MRLSFLGLPIIREEHKDEPDVSQPSTSTTALGKCFFFILNYFFHLPDQQQVHNTYQKHIQTVCSPVEGEGFAAFFAGIKRMKFKWTRYRRVKYSPKLNK